MAIRLKQNGIEDFIVLERAPTWVAHGTSTPIPAAAATSLRICTHSRSRPTRTGRTPTPPQPEIRDYLRRCTEALRYPPGTSSPGVEASRRPRGARSGPTVGDRHDRRALHGARAGERHRTLTDPEAPGRARDRELPGQGDALRAVGPRLSAGRQACRLDRHRRIGDPVRAGDPGAGREAVRVPAHGAVDHAPRQPPDLRP